MTSSKRDCDCPTWPLWKFPAPGDSALMSDYPQSSSFEIERYLEKSSHHPSTTGFGATALYKNDVIQLDWPTNFEVPVYLHRNWYCMACEQKIENEGANGEFNWGSCYRTPGDGKSSGIWSMSFATTSPISSTFSLNWGTTAGAESMICALGFPSAMPGGLTQTFPFINKKPPPGRGRRISTAGTPEGEPYPEDKIDKTSYLCTVGGAVMLALFLMLLGRFAWQKKKQRQAARALTARFENESLVGGPKMSPYSDDA